MDLVNAIAARGAGLGVLSLMREPAVATSDVLCGLQVADFDSFAFFLSFLFFFLIVLPSVNFHLENSFLAVH
jgi:hypothetical protein